MCGPLARVSVLLVLLGTAGATSLPRVRVCDGSTNPEGHFAYFSREPVCNGTVFKPRGSNYIRLNRTSIGVSANDAPADAYHSTFSLGHWNRSEAESALQRMKQLRFDMVRVFIDDGRTFCGIHTHEASHGTSDVGLVPVLPCNADSSRPNGINGPFASAGGARPLNSSSLLAPQPSWLSAEYMDNFADFLRLAAANDVYVMPTLQRFPCNDRFLALTQPLNTSEVSEGNADYLHEGTRRAKAVYLASFAQALLDRVGPALLTTVLGFSLENEARGWGGEPPFSVSGLVLPDALGVPRNMSVADDRRQLLDEGFAAWANVSAAAVRAVDPHALVTAGMFTYFAVGFPHVSPPGPGQGTGADVRFPPNPAHLSRHSTLDYLDLHLYPSSKDFNISEDILSEDFEHIRQAEVPLLLGEFGAFRKPFPSFVDALHVLKDLVLTSCAPPFRFQGWLTWTWDTFEQAWMLWDLADQGQLAGHNATLAELMSPHNFVDQCFS